jgi:apolipoprotein D and lipocalin family protein
VNTMQPTPQRQDNHQKDECAADKALGSYNVIALDKEYRYALVCGPDRDYLWLLARAPTIAPEVRQQMLDIATRQGFDVGKLVWVNQRYD